MELPTELLAHIVTSGLDSFATLKSWCEISPYFQKLVKQKLGVIVVTDFDYNGDFRASPAPLDYTVLSGDVNTLVVSTDDFNLEKTLTFLNAYTNILMVITTDRTFSEPLSTCITQVADGLISRSDGIRHNICVVYKTKKNFLSKLYFRELWLRKKAVRLCELHVVGNPSPTAGDMCNIDMIFEVTHLHDVKSLYTLSIPANDHKLVAPQLQVIRQLEMGSDVQLYACLTGCPNLSQIKQLHLPSTVLHTYSLPSCDTITLTNFNPQVNRSVVDGERVASELIVKTSFKSPNPAFSRLCFPLIKKLTVELPGSPIDPVRFECCDFSKLRDYQCLSFTEWDSFFGTGASLTSLKVAINDKKGVEWLNDCPFQITHLDILSTKSDPVSRISQGDIRSLQKYWSQLITNCTHISFELKSLFQCIIFKHLILPRLSKCASLELKVDEFFIQEEITKLSQRDLGSKLGELGLTYLDESLSFNLPSMRKFKLIKDRSDTEFTERKNSASESGPNTGAIVYADPLAKDAYATNYAISPSEFRRNSLAGIDSVTARRNSTIVISNPFGSDTGFQLRRKSSSGGYSVGSTLSTQSIVPGYQPVSPLHVMRNGLIRFIQTGEIPDVVTMSLNSFANSIDFSNCFGNVARLEVSTETIDCKDTNIDELLSHIYKNVGEVLKYPLESKLKNASFQRLLVIQPLDSVAGPGPDLDSLAARFEDFLEFNNHNVTVCTADRIDTTAHISVVLSRL